MLLSTFNFYLLLHFSSGSVCIYIIYKHKNDFTSLYNRIIVYSSKFSLSKMSTISIVNHPSVGQYTSPHFVHVNTGVATEEQFNAAIKDAIKKSGRKSNYKISLVANKNGTPFGYGYVWFINSEIANMLIRKEPNGMERCDWVPDPQWVPIENPVSWGDIADNEDPPRIKVEKKPLLELSPYKMTPEQEKFAKEQGVEILQGGFGAFKCDPGYVSDPDVINYIPNCMFAPNFNPEITAMDLKGLFSVFSTSEDKMYPKVEIIQNRAVLITFDPATHDASFAVKLSRKITVYTQKGKKSHVLYFNLYQNKRR